MSWDSIHIFNSWSIPQIKLIQSTLVSKLSRSPPTPAMPLPHLRWPRRHPRPLGLAIQRPTTTSCASKKLDHSKLIPFRAARSLAPSAGPRRRKMAESRQKETPARWGMSTDSPTATVIKLNRKVLKLINWMARIFKLGQFSKVGPLRNQSSSGIDLERCTIISSMRDSITNFWMIFQIFLMWIDRK